MVRCIFAIFLGMAASLSLEAQTHSKAEDLPSVSILLPANIPSETVQISYFLIGPFGGYGSRTEQRVGLHSYEISALVEGKAATEIRMIVYVSGCEIKTFISPLRGDSRVEQELATYQGLAYPAMNPSGLGPSRPSSLQLLVRQGMEGGSVETRHTSRARRQLLD